MLFMVVMLSVGFGVFRWPASVALLEAFAHVGCGAESCLLGNLRDAQLSFLQKSGCIPEPYVADKQAWRLFEKGGQFPVKSRALHAKVAAELHDGIPWSVEILFHEFHRFGYESLVGFRKRGRLLNGAVPELSSSGLPASPEISFSAKLSEPFI